MLSGQQPLTLFSSRQFQFTVQYIRQFFLELANICCNQQKLTNVHRVLSSCGFQWCGFHSCVVSENSPNIQLMWFSLHNWRNPFTHAFLVIRPGVVTYWDNTLKSGLPLGKSPHRFTQNDYINENTNNQSPMDSRSCYFFLALEGKLVKIIRVLSENQSNPQPLFPTQTK